MNQFVNKIIIKTPLIFNKISSKRSDKRGTLFCHRNRHCLKMKKKIITKSMEINLISKNL